MKKILIVDDDDTFRGAVQTALEETKRYEVKSASNAADGLNIVASDVPDAILLDIKMPGLSGIDFLEQLRSLEHGKDVKVIIMTNDSSLDTISRGAELGIKNYILKSGESLTTINDMVDKLFAGK